MGRTALGRESDGSAESRAASRRGEVSEQLKNGKPFLLRGVSDIEAPGADAFFVPVRSRDRQLAAHIVGYTDGGRRAFEETNYVPIF